MVQIYKKMMLLLDKKQKRTMVGIVFMMLIGAILEALGISAVIPVVQVVMDENALEKYEVPYHYEAPLDLKFHGIIHPDFTVLNVRLRKEYRWEHLGKMDDEGYCEYALNRILLYEMHGFFPGKELIFTHETLKKPINSKLIDEIILKYLK